MTISSSYSERESTRKMILYPAWYTVKENTDINDSIKLQPLSSYVVQQNLNSDQRLQPNDVTKPQFQSITDHKL